MFVGHKVTIRYTIYKFLKCATVITLLVYNLTIITFLMSFFYFVHFKPVKSLFDKPIKEEKKSNNTFKVWLRLNLVLLKYYIILLPLFCCSHLILEKNRQ